ncbi:unnamed protein product [Lepeophtheirus salmonis]|uniref:(salmon louse) hypothetical protein n=1 Tax=Lepeophtheirus salmonis TaxID=72036 RepID=A0A7R8CDI7_LEPSM|nr:unnamed protein product [Lepeophtheirus salmonis]CAF2779666.1 unnamed protein product [Lepeophtheirus salmonis]
MKKNQWMNNIELIEKRLRAEDVLILEKGNDDHIRANNSDGFRLRDEESMSCNSNLSPLEKARLIFGDKPSPDLSQSAVRFCRKKYVHEYAEAGRVLFEDTYFDKIDTSMENDSFKVHVQACVSEICETLSPEWFNFVLEKQNSEIADIKFWNQSPSFLYDEDWLEELQDISECL